MKNTVSTQQHGAVSVASSACTWSPQGMAGVIMPQVLKGLRQRK